MAVQIIKPVDTEFPMNSLTVEADTATEEEFSWISLLCCSYAHHYTTATDPDSEEDIGV